MPKLVSMKITSGGEVYASAPSAPAYPYGLQLRLDTECLERLGFDVSDYSVGDELMLTARVEICETGAYESIVGGESQNLTLQVTAMNLGTAPKKDPASALYKEE
jgi:hypothetical protein